MAGYLACQIHCTTDIVQDTKTLYGYALHNVQLTQEAKIQ